MLEPDAEPSAGGAPTTDAPRRPLSPIRRWLSRRRRLREIMRSLDEGIALVLRLSAALAAFEPRLQKLESDVAELATIPTALSRLQSAWQQQIAVQRHTIEVLWAQPNLAQPNLVKLQSALRQQIALHRHLIETARSLERDIPHKIDEVLRRDLDLGLNGPSVLAGAVSGLWDNFSQLHAQVQGI